MFVGRKIYYELATGNVLVITSEMQGEVVKTTVEQDFEIYDGLVGKNPNAIGVITLEYGELRNEFMNAIGYKVNLDNKQIEFTFGTLPNDPQPTPDQIRITQLEAENTDLKSRMTDLEMFAADIISGGI